MSLPGFRRKHITDLKMGFSVLLQVIQKALWRWASGEADGEETMEAVVADLHTGSLVLYGHFFIRTQQDKEFGSRTERLSRPF